MAKKNSKKNSNSGKKRKSEIKNSIKKNLKLNLERYVNPNLITKFLPLFLILFVMVFAFNIRDGPSDLEGLKERIEANTYNQVRSLIIQEVNSQYPSLNQIYKDELVNEKLQEAIEKRELVVQNQLVDIDNIINNNFNNVKNSFQAENGQTYLLAIDPYHFLRLAENTYLKGYPGEELVETEGETKAFQSYKLAPQGLLVNKNPELHVWLEAKLFALNGINENSTIGEMTSAVFLLPVFIVLLCVIPIYFLTREITNDLFALFASLFLVSIGTFVSRTIAGFVDIDAHNVLFPLVIICLIYFSLITSKKYLPITFSLLAGLSQGLFLWAWPPGWFIFVFVFLSLLAYLSYTVLLNLYREKKLERNFFKTEKNLIYSILGFSVSSFIFVWYFAKLNIFTHSLYSLLGNLSNIAGITTSNIWPNVLSSVAELNPASFNQIVNSVGGQFVFFLAMAGILALALDFKVQNSNYTILKRSIFGVGLILFWAIIKYNFLVNLTANSDLFFLFILFSPIGVALLLGLINHNNDRKVFMVIILSVWLAGTIFLSFNGVRFILLLAPAFAISFSLGLYYIAKIINNLIKKEFNLQNKIKASAPGFAVVSILFIILFMPLAKGAVNISNNSLPNFDDAWYTSMNEIKENSSEDAIITSWWDFGHFFTAVSKRGVTFDGGTQGYPQSHWVGKLLLEEDEKVSREILRMLSCGANGAFDYMFKVSEDKTSGVRIVEQIIYPSFEVDLETKKEIIRNYPYYNFSEEEVSKAIKLLACEKPPETFLITSQDMIGKAPVWAHWGSWDFTKKYVHDNYRVKSIEEISIELDKNISLIGKYIKELEEIDLRSKTENIKREDLINRWFAPYPSYVALEGRYFHDCVSTNLTFECLNGIVSIDKVQGKVSVSDQVPLSVGRFIFPSISSGFEVIEQEGGGDLDILLVQSANGPQIMFIQTPLGTSLFTKLYYLDGADSKYFDSFYSTQSATGIGIKTWKVNWDDELNE